MDNDAANMLIFLGLLVLMVLVGFGPTWFTNAKNATKRARDNHTAESNRSKHLYKRALATAEKEINEGTQEEGTWAQALVEAKGDEVQRKVKYLELRAGELREQWESGGEKSS